MKRVSAIINKITVEDKEVNIKILGNFVPYSRGHRDKYGAPEEPDEEAYFEILETSINNVEYTDEQLAKLLGVSEDDIDEILQDALGEALEEDMESWRESQAQNRLDNMHDDMYYK